MASLTVGQKYGVGVGAVDPKERLFTLALRQYNDQMNTNLLASLGPVKAGRLKSFFMETLAGRSFQEKNALIYLDLALRRLDEVSRWVRASREEYDQARKMSDPVIWTGYKGPEVGKRVPQVSDSEFSTTYRDMTYFRETPRLRGRGSDLDERRRTPYETTYEGLCSGRIPASTGKRVSFKKVVTYIP